MADRAIDTYLNDHLAGAMFGSDLAEQLRSRGEDAVGELLERLTPEIEADRQTSSTSWSNWTFQNPSTGRSVGGREGQPRMKFGDLGDAETGLANGAGDFSLGVEGKLALSGRAARGGGSLCRAQHE